MGSWKAEKVKCDYLKWERPVRRGRRVVEMQPVCTKEGAPNYEPTLDRPFAEKCRNCPENTWPDKD